ncbi:hypothetical protein GCM10011519_03370 [Marmoricola endophyticus]|uniref:Band 7 domain-containing protein n=1 Tax=Marmoricola endophyticus TaxID=2040280 RepID=A0A917BBA7_9ACTN|nr:SPFH domain-containing protein [Marmoricola endophyticus]GGF33241.1 hypothetical protein GCM10011519_03370 [Marmoricola endophyticus]
MVIVVIVVLVAAALVAGASRLRMVPAGHVGVVTQQGTYVRMVTAGLLWLPPREQVSVVSSTDRQVSATASVSSSDAASVAAELRVVYRVDDPVRYLTAVDDASYAVEREAVAALRELASRTTVAELAASNVRAAETVRAALETRVHRWGVAVRRVDVVVRTDG